MNMLTRLDLGGFKSIRNLTGLELGRLNVLIGANGSGKTNLVSFFRLLGWMTRSMTLIDYFDPEHIVVVDRPGRETSFRRLDPEKLREWLAEYSVSELWEKNVLGGRPAG